MVSFVINNEPIFFFFLYLGLLGLCTFIGLKGKSNKYRKENSLSNWSTSARGAGNNQDFIEEDMMVLIVELPSYLLIR